MAVDVGTAKNGGVANAMAAQPGGSPPRGTSAESDLTVHR
jgi:hypothetical protein